MVLGRGMAHWVKVLAPNINDLRMIPEPTGWKGRISSCKLPSHLHTHGGTCTPRHTYIHIHTHPKINVLFCFLKED